MPNCIQAAAHAGNSATRRRGTRLQPLDRGPLVGRRESTQESAEPAERASNAFRAYRRNRSTFPLEPRTRALPALFQSPPARERATSPLTAPGEIVAAPHAGATWSVRSQQKSAAQNRAC